jgi:hypothetical protein
MIIHENHGCSERTHNFIEISKCVMAVANKNALPFRLVQNYCRVGDRKFIRNVRIYIPPCTALLPEICRYNDQLMGWMIRGSNLG